MMSDQQSADPRAALGNPESMLAVLDSWASVGWIRNLDAAFARFLFNEGRSNLPSAPLLLAAALASHQTAHGHVCLDLQACLASPAKVLALPPEYSTESPPLLPTQLLAQLDLHDWLRAIKQAPFTSDGPGNTPLVLEQEPDTLLYLRRYWSHERRLGGAIAYRLAHPADVDGGELRVILDKVFGPPPAVKTSDPLENYDWQRIACALAVRYPFSIITGGPGTGKTTTVIRLLLTLSELHTEPLRIRLAAPTGKAAARLSTSIRAQRDRMSGKEQIPSVVSTVHRLLGPIRGSRFFRHNASNPLPVDVVVIDEASMVDVELMARLIDALPQHARLILLGDKDQLASVEAGALLGTLCQRAADVHYTNETVRWLEACTGQLLPASVRDDNGTALDQAITLLRHSHRFSATSGIGALARAVNSPTSTRAAADRHEFDRAFQNYNDVKRLRIGSIADTSLEALLSDTEYGYGYYLALLNDAPAPDEGDLAYDQWALRVLEAHSRFQLLTAVRQGEFGVEALNIYIRQLLQRRGLLPETGHSRAEWYPGRPVMVTRNDYGLDLMNGDVGITLMRGSRLRVAFPDSAAADRIRWILPSRLQDSETVFAMTVHKSQGSEFDHTALVLPPYDSPVLTRELVYTGVTRARTRFTLIESNAAVLAQAVATPVFRISGLMTKIALEGQRPDPKQAPGG